MKKYIDADIVNLKLKQICDKRNTSYGVQFGGRAKDFAQLTDDIPAADVAEVVRCKDCKHFKKENNGCCSFCSGLSVTDGNGYCSYGERAERG